MDTKIMLQLMHHLPTGAVIVKCEPIENPKANNYKAKLIRYNVEYKIGDKKFVTNLSGHPGRGQKR